MKINDNGTVTMLFHGFGEVSEEECDVVSINKNVVILDNGHRFDTNTGECLDDDTTFGCYRTLKI